MAIQSDLVEILHVTADNVAEIGIYCIRDKNAPGFRAKVDWFRSKINQGLAIKIAAQQNKQLGFIEYIPSEIAWRPVKADNYLFIQCIGIFVAEARQKGIGTALLKACELDAIQNAKSGICAISSDGAWMANKTLFEKNGYARADKLDRFELLFKKLNNEHPKPEFIDWTKQQAGFTGWNLVYADQCPWHDKSVGDLQQSALEHGITLKVSKLASPQEARMAPSGFGTFSLVRDGRLLADHYLSRKRFENILRQEMP